LPEKPYKRGHYMVLRAIYRTIIFNDVH